MSCIFFSGKAFYLVLPWVTENKEKLPIKFDIFLKLKESLKFILFNNFPKLLFAL